MLFFANYETILVEDGKLKKKKAMGGKRMMWTSHTTFADAKNRFGLPEKMPFDYAGITQYITSGANLGSPAASDPEQVKTPGPVKPAQVPEAKSKPEEGKPAPKNKHETLLEKARALMRQAEIPEETVKEAIGKKGYFPADMSIDQYPDEFIDGVLIGAWEQIKKFIEDEKIPF